MRKLVYVLILILLISNIPALRISEIEMNPNDDCRDCTEWAEFYSEDEVNLEGYFIENAKGETISLSGTFEGYFVFEFGKQFLTNSEDKLILKNEQGIVDESPLLSDEKNNDLTRQFCGNSWEFLLSSKGEKNSCEEEEETETEEEEPEEVVEENKTIIPEEFPSLQEETPEEIQTVQLSESELNSKDIKTNFLKEILDENFALVGIITFCIGFGALFLIKKRKYKNEFN